MYEYRDVIKEELAWVIDKRLRAISNIMVFKTLVPLRTKEKTRLKFKTILDALLCGQTVLLRFLAQVNVSKAMN